MQIGRAGGWPQLLLLGPSAVTRLLEAETDLPRRILASREAAEAEDLHCDDAVEREGGPPQAPFTAT